MKEFFVCMKLKKVDDKLMCVYAFEKEDGKMKCEILHEELDCPFEPLPVFCPHSDWEKFDE